MLGPGAATGGPLSRRRVTARTVGTQEQKPEEAAEASVIGTGLAEATIRERPVLQLNGRRMGPRPNRPAIGRSRSPDCSIRRLAA